MPDFPSSFIRGYTGRVGLRYVVWRNCEGKVSNRGRDHYVQDLQRSRSLRFPQAALWWSFESTCDKNGNLKMRTEPDVIADGFCPLIIILMVGAENIFVVIR